jgi:D-arabinose 5-phosphate isomerase GutQ
MHKSHQARMTTLSNQLHQEHSEEWNALTQTLDKELEEKQNSSEWADVANKRKEMVDLERSIQVTGCGLSSHVLLLTCLAHLI